MDTFFKTLEQNYVLIKEDIESYYKENDKSN